jgi:hypothetical protein
LDPKPDRLAFISGMALAMAVTVAAITTLAAPLDPESKSAAPIPRALQRRAVQVIDITASAVGSKRFNRAAGIGVPGA